MTTPPPARPPRRPFPNRPEPEPFHKSPEFQRFLLFAGMLVVVGLAGLYVAAKTKQREAAETRQAEQEAALPPLSSPEEIEARKLRLKTLFEGALADTENGEDFRETSGYGRLLEIVASYPPEEFSRLAVRRLDWKAAMADPDAWRGEFVRARGILTDAYAVKLREPLFGRTDVYQGILTEADGEEGVFFDTPDPLPSVALRRDPVDVEGIFYRTVRYVTFNAEKPKKGGQPLSPYRTKTAEGDVQTAPYLIVKTVRQVETPKRDAGAILSDHPAAILAAIGLAIGAVHLLMYWFQRRSRRRAASQRADRAGFREMFEKKQRERGRAPGPRSEA